MSRKIVLTNCTVELTLPDLEVVSRDIQRAGPSRITLTTREYVHDAVVRCGDKTMKIARLFVREVHGWMLPVLNESGQVVLFTTEENVRPDATVGGKPCE
jgi:hypothetical protein